MPIPQTLGNDQVEGTADRICGGMTENALRARVLETNNAIPVCRDDRFRAGTQQRLRNQA